MKHLRTTLYCTLIPFLFAPPAIGDSGVVNVFIATHSPSVAEYVINERNARGAAPSRQQQSRHARLLSQQHQLLSQQLAPLVVKEHSRLRVALSGFRATVRRADLPTLRNTQGVKSVTPLKHHTLANIDSVPWVQAPELWKTLGDGDDMTIAIIDSGIDYLHANFGGLGDPQAYADNDRAVIEDASFPTSKVIGGWDFAGPTYNSRIDDAPLPDPDPLDGHGHGSHVAGTAAGLGVDGYVGAGVARGAKLLAIKVFSDIGGSTDLVVDGIDMALDPNGDGAIDDRVDVINMSLGARFGLATDPSAIAASNAVQAGVIVVTSAGNNGDLAYVTGSPGVSPEVITVAASISGGRRQIALATDLDERPLMPALESASPARIGPSVQTMPLAVAYNADGDLSDACEPLAETFNGKAVIVARGGCLFPDKFTQVQAAGGAALILRNSSDDVNNLFIMGGIYPENIHIPGLMITSLDGDRLIEALAAADTAIRLSTSFSLPTGTHLDDVIASFSSQGPGAGRVGLKPDLAAPGRFTVSTQAGTGFAGVQRRGTSMAAPHVAGMAALLRQQYPTLEPRFIKALLMNSAQPSQQDGPGTDTPEPLTRQGIGVMRGADASRLTSLIEPASASFGYINPLVSKSARRVLTLHNLDNTPRRFRGSQDIATSLNGIDVTCPAEIEVDALGTADVRIELFADANALDNDDALLNRREASGWCVFSDERDTLRVGYVVGADGASNIHPTAHASSRFRQRAAHGPRGRAAPASKASDRALRTHKLPTTSAMRSSATGRSTLALTNSGPQKGIAHSFVLTGHAGDDRSNPIEAFGWRHTELFTQPVLEVAVALRDPWDNPSNYRFFLRLNTDNDPAAERTLFAVDWSRLGFDPGIIITGLDYLEDLNDVGTDNSVSHWIAENVDYNDRTIILPWFNAEQGPNALFKPHERRFDVTLIVLDRYGNASELSGTIDLDNPAANAQSTRTLTLGDEVATTSNQLWLFPTNPAPTQSLIIP
ncbi:MAG: S8 family serine peptidase [Pseudomonadota bacterium]